MSALGFRTSECSIIIFLFHNNEYYCLLMACSSSILYKRAIRKDQGERSAAAFPWAINILHSLRYRISNKQNTRNITSNLIIIFLDNSGNPAPISLGSVAMDAQ